MSTPIAALLRHPRLHRCIAESVVVGFAVVGAALLYQFGERPAHASTCTAEWFAQLRNLSALLGFIAGATYAGIRLLMIPSIERFADAMRDDDA